MRCNEPDDGLTGTFFCEITTAQFLPRTPTEVMLTAVIALNAYSVPGQLARAERSTCSSHTNLIQTTLVREDGEMSINAAGCRFEID